MSKDEERLARQREIAAFAAEMVSTAPKVQSKGAGRPQPPGKGLFASLDIKTLQLGAGAGAGAGENDEEDGPRVVLGAEAGLGGGGAGGGDDDSDSDEGFEQDDYDDSAVRAGDGVGGEEHAGGDNDNDEDEEGGRNAAHDDRNNDNDDDNGDDSDDAEGGGGGDSIEAYATAKKVPISHQVELTGHTKAVTCMSLEPAGARVVTGSLDYSTKLFDFGGMDSRHRSFRSVEVQDGYPVTSVRHAPGGDRYLVGTGSSQPRVYDREGKELLRFAKGDMYIRDMVNTKGHTMEVTSVCWHPTERNIVLTASLDGTMRVWDLVNCTQVLGGIANKHVLKLRAAAAGQNRLGATSCCYARDASKVIAGAADGTVHIWVEKKTYTSRADFVLRPANATGKAVTCVMTSPDDRYLATRSDDGAIRVWDLSPPALHAANTSKSGASPVMTYPDLPNDYPSANVDFSPDGTLLCCGTTPVRGDAEAKPLLCFFEVPSPGKPRVSPAPVLQICVADKGVSAVFVRWQPNTNQILCSTSTGGVKVSRLATPRARTPNPFY